MYARGTINRNGKHHWPSIMNHVRDCCMYKKKYKYGSIFSHWSVVYIGHENKRNNWRTYNAYIYSMSFTNLVLITLSSCLNTYDRIETSIDTTSI